MPSGRSWPRPSRACASSTRRRSPNTSAISAIPRPFTPCARTIAPPTASTSPWTARISPPDARLPVRCCCCGARPAASAAITSRWRFGRAMHRTFAPARRFLAGTIFRTKRRKKPIASCASSLWRRTRGRLKARVPLGMAGHMNTAAPQYSHWCVQLREVAMAATPATTVNVRYMVDDVDAAVAWYTKHLGFKLLSNAAPAFADVTLGSLRLLLSGPKSSAGRAMPDGDRPGPGGWNRIHLVVDDISAEVARLRAAGVEFRKDIVSGPGGSQILLKDPSGNLVELFQPARR